MAVDKQMFTYKLNEIHEQVYNHTKRMLNTYLDEVQLSKVDSSEKGEVYDIFAEEVLKAAAKAVGEYMDPKKLYDLLDRLEPYYEDKKNNKPTLKEAQDRVALIAGQKKLNEMFSGADEENDAVEDFCILMDWEVKPEDVLHCVKNADGNFTMQIADGTQFTYDPANDCIVEEI